MSASLGPPTTPAMPTDGEFAELSIESLAAGGDGVGRDDSGRVVFVPFCAPGDRVRVRIVERKERFSRGELDKVLERGSTRATPRCPVFGRCGGCAWQHVSYTAQQEAKEKIVRDALERIARIPPEETPQLTWFPSPEPYAYRARARVLVSSGRAGFRARGTHELVPVDGCPILLPELDAALRSFAAAPDSEESGEEEWELASDAGRRARWTSLRAPPELRALRVDCEELEVSTGVFTQTNPLLVDTWSRYVCEAAGTGTRVLELFAGVGTLSLALARRGSSLVAVESDETACTHLRANLERAALTASVLTKRVDANALAGWLDQHRPQVVVLDPPRSGLGRAASGVLGVASVERVVYAACDPAPWARDLRVLREAGFFLERAAGFDFFPQTAHVETVAVLTRSRRPF